MMVSLPGSRSFCAWSAFAHRWLPARPCRGSPVWKRHKTDPPIRRLGVACKRVSGFGPNSAKTS